MATWHIEGTTAVDPT